MLLNEIVTAFKSFFSASFWFGSFLPVAIVAVLHVAIASIVFPNTINLLKVLENPTGSAAYVPLAFGGLVVLAYALTPLNGLFRAILDGSFLPQWLHDELRADLLKEARAVRDAREAASFVFRQYVDINLERRSSFAQHRKTGTALPQANDAQLVEAAERAIAEVARIVDAGKIPPPETAEKAADALEAALAKNNADLQPPHTDAAVAKRLDEAHRRLWRLLNDTETEARHDLDMRWLPYQATVAIDNPQATRVGNARVIAETYSQKVYRVDFGYIWPRLLLVMPETDATTKRIGAAQSQLDFAVLAFALSGTLPLVWLPMILCYAGPLWLFIVLGVGTPFLMRFLYQLVVESQIAFGEAAKTVIDKYRFKLIEDLRLPLPGTLLAEQELWIRLRQAQQTGQAYDLFYKHPKSAG